MFLGIPVRALRPALLSLLIAFTLVPIMGLPYTADDNVNRSWPTIGIPEAIDSGVNLTRQWMLEQGRFFPGGAVYGITMWNVMDSRLAYMTYLALLAIFLVALVAFITWRITRSGQLAALTTVALGAAMQVRLGGAFDGLASFGGLIVYTLVLTIISGLLAAHVLRGGSLWFTLPMAVAWSLAITAYEVSLLMLPAILVLLYVTGPALRQWRSWAWATAPLIVPAILQLGVTMFLRGDALAPAPAYQVNLGGPVGTTTGMQFTAALPFSQQGWAGVPLNATVSVMLVLVLGLPLFLAWKPWVNGAVRVPLRASAGLMVAGLWAWLIPSLLAGVTVRWQAELIWGQGYVYLPYEFVGFALFMTGVATLLRVNAHRPWARVAFVVLFACLVAGCAVTAGVNIFAVGTIVPGAQGPG